MCRRVYLKILSYLFQDLERKLALETSKNTALATKITQFADLMLEKDAEIKKLKEKSNNLKEEVTVINEGCCNTVPYKKF